MAELTREAQLDPITRATAVNLIGRSRHPIDFAARVTRWVRRRMLLIDEPVEMLHRPEWVLGEMARARRVVGDCDDAAMLAGALVTALGIPVAYVATWDPETPEDGHVIFAAADPDGQWFEFDPTSPARVPADWAREVVYV